jgi:hypothetical protein
MKYVITMCDGEFKEPPIAIDVFLDLPDVIRDIALYDWIRGKPYYTNSGRHFLIDLPV